MDQVRRPAWEGKAESAAYGFSFCIVIVCAMYLFLRFLVPCLDMAKICSFESSSRIRLLLLSSSPFSNSKIYLTKEGLFQ